MKSITVKNAADVKAALDVLDAPAEKAISILQNALVMLDDTEKSGGGGNASQYGKRNRACKDFLNMMSNAAAVIVELARMALDEGDTRRAAVFVRDAANIRDILKRHATK